MRHETVSGEVVAAASQNIKERDYWLEKLGGRLERAFFPYDYPQRIHDGKMDAINLEFHGEIFSKFMQLSKGIDYTLHMILMAGIIGILEKYTSNNDIIVGTPIYKQKDEGRFINTLLVLRHHINGVGSFKELLLLVRQTLIEATEHQNYPLETLLYKLNIEYTRGEFPLFDIAVLLKNIHDKKYIRDVNINMIFSFLRTDHSIKGTVEYNPQRYHRQSVERYIHHLVNFFKEALFNVDMQRDDIEILSGEEKRQLIHDFNDTSAEIPYLKGKTIYSLFADQVKKAPGNLAVKGPAHYNSTFVDGGSLTYEMLDRRVRQLADFLIKKGMRHGDIIGIMVKRSLEMIVGMLSILKTGGAYLPIDTEYPDNRIKYILRDSNAKLLLTKDCPEEGIESAIETISINLENSFYDVEPLQRETVSRVDDIAYVIYTSGSTGKPKGVMVEHRSIVNTLFWRKNYYQFNQDDRIMQIPSFSFDSSVEDIFTPLISGSGLVLLPEENRYNVEFIRTLMERNNITHFLIVPGFYKILLMEIPNGLKGLKSVTVAGEGFTEMLVKEHFKALPHVKMYNEYGPTENSVCSTVYEFSMNKTKVLIGKPITNVSCFICSTRGILAPLHVYGELSVSGRGLARGYLNNPELSIEKFVNNPFLDGERIYLTGDVARWKPDGNIEFSGRQDHQVKIRGFRIETGEIEERLLNHETIKEAVVIVKEDENGEKYLCAYLVSDKKINVTELRGLLSKDLPDYMIPSKFMQLSHLPLLVNGKVDRKALPEPEIEAGEEYMPPRDEQERKLTGIWANVLGLEPEIIGIDSDFFNLGGHSLSATILVSKIHKEFNIKLPLKEIFRSATVRELAVILKQSVKEKFVSIEPLEEKEYYALSSAQKRLYILNRMNQDDINYNINHVIELNGELDKEALLCAFHQLITRHESFRTSFEMINGEPVQRIHENIDLKIEFFNSDNSCLNANIADFIRPFDLESAPLLRVGLIQVAEMKNILMVDMHHIISDGISLIVLIKNFTQFYRGEELPRLRLQYKDFSGWQNREEIRETGKHQEKYWLKEFEKEIPLLDLPTDFPRQVIQNFEGGILNCEIDKRDTAALKAIAMQEGATLFMLVLALYNILLFKISGQEDIVVGTPVSGRFHNDLEHIVGMFVNTLALRSFPRGGKNVKQFLNEVKTRMLDAFSNQDFPYEELVEKVVISRDTSRNPIFDVMFVFDNIFTAASESTEQELKGLTIKSFSHEHRTAKFDLTLLAIERAGKLCFSFEYCTKLFKQETISRFIQYFKKIISSAIQDPGKSISDINILTDEEKRLILYEFNDTEASYPKDKTIHELFEKQAVKRPDSISVVGQSAQRTAHSAEERHAPYAMHHAITYGELNERSNQLARQLQKVGVHPDSIAAIMVERSIEMVIGIMAILKAGGAYLPIAPDYPQERINYMMADSAAKILLTSDAINRVPTPHQLSFHPSTLPSLSTLTSTSTCQVSPTNLAYIIYTSGSTGKPKGVMVEHRNVVNVVTWFGRTHCLGPHIHVLQMSDYTFDASVNQIFGTLVHGSVLYLVNKTVLIDTIALRRFIQAHFIHVINFVPSFINELLCGEDNEKLESLLSVISGAENLDDTVKDRILKKGYRLYNQYGPTETTIDALAAECSEQKVNLGKPIANVKCYILNQYNHLLPVGIPGELVVSGAGVSRGYLNRPNLTAEKFVDQVAGAGDRYRCKNNKKFLRGVQGGGFCKKSPPGRRRQKIYLTGDLARWMPDGNIEFLGRTDHQVKIRGFRIELGEIEFKLREYDKIKDAVVTINTDKHNEKNLCAYVVLYGDTEHREQEQHESGLDISQLKTYLLDKLPDYMIPRYFVKIDHIPLNPNGKLDKRSLPAPGMDFQAVYSPPTNETEKKLVEIWAELLGLEAGIISIDSNFFQLGGHSLSGIVLAAQIHKSFKVKVPLPDIFRLPTVRQLAQLLETSSKMEFISIEPVEQKEYYPLCSAQKRLFFIQQMDRQSTAYNVPNMVEIEGRLEKEKLENVFKKLMDRHESFRTSFEMIEDEPVQKIHQDVEVEIEYYGVSPVEVEVKAEEWIHVIIKNFIRTFDLSKSPLLRVGLIKTNEEKHILMLDMHHIVTDGVSFGIFVQDLMELYSGLELQELKLQYKDYAEWQNKLYKSGEIDKQKDFWLNRFKGEIPVPDLATDYSRPTIRNSEGHTIHFPIDDDVIGRLNRMKVMYDVTMYMILLAVFNILLSKYAGQTDIIVGTPTVGRNHADLERINGFFVNVVVMRNLTEGEKSFEEFLSEVRKNSLQAFENQDYPFEELVEELDIKRDSSRNPLYEAIFASIIMDIQTIEIQGLKLRPYIYENKTAKTDLRMGINEGNGKIEMTLTYATALFKRETAEKMAQHYIDILKQVVENNKVKLKDIRVSHRLGQAKPAAFRDNESEFDF